MTVPPSTHFKRVARNASYYIRGYWAGLVCAVRGHDVVRSVDMDAGFITYWCRRCAEGDL